MSDVFGLEDAYGFLERWFVWAGGSVDYICYVNCLYLSVYFVGIGQKNKW